MSQVDILLNQFPRALRTIQDHYERDLRSVHVSDELLIDIRHLVADLRAAPDFVATDLDRAFGKAKKRSPYFPLSTDVGSFAAAMAKDFLTVPENVKVAMERHQPYQPGKELLAQLPALSRVNGHQDFTEQTRTEQRQWTQGGVTWTEGVSFSGGVFVNGQPMGHPAYTTETVFVGWTFLDPPHHVIPTLHGLAGLVTDLVHDVQREAGL
ncbi:MAG: hypothetical protein PSX37_01900 [bacterium]|nr:hypothetical protein [bacterium]